MSAASVQLVSASSSVRAKLVIQQCLSATLKLPPNYNEESVLRIRRGLVVFVCFLKGATEETAIKAAEAICHTELSSSPTQESDNSKHRVSVLRAGGDILIIPQASQIGSGSIRLLINSSSFSKLTLSPLIYLQTQLIHSLNSNIEYLNS